MLASVLLLVPATTTLGAVFYFPIVLNVTVLTWSIGFHGTVYVTALMLLASIFLLCWDYDRLRSILFAPAMRPSVTSAPVPPVEGAGYVLGTVAGLAMLAATRGLVPMSVVRWMLLAGGVAVLLVLAGWIQAAWAHRGRGEVTPSGRAR